MKNSIKDNLTNEDVVAEIQLSLSGEREKYYIAVEGKSDVKFINKLLLSDKVEIHEMPGSKDGVLYACSVINSERFFGVCDKDYKHTGYPKNCMVYDYCSLETMLFYTNGVIDDFYLNLDIQKDDEKNLIMESITSYIGAIRKYNFDMNLSYNFCSLRACDYCDKDLEVDKQKVRNKLMLSNNGLPIDENIVNNNCKIIEKKDLINGHDLIEAIQYLYQVKHKPQEMVDRLVLCGSRDDLKETNFYQMLLKQFPEECLR